MLPLSAETPPTSATELTAALQRGFEELQIIPRKIAASGGAFPALETLQIDLTEARFTRDLRPRKPQGAAGTAVSIGEFELLGSPVYLEKAPLEVKVSARQAEARVTWEAGSGALLLDSASDGSVSIETDREALEKALHELAVEAAAKQGLEVRETHLTLTQEGPRSVSFRAEVKAKVFIMTAALALTGKLAIDEALNARLSSLSLDGDAMILKLAGGYARPYLDRLEGRDFSLAALLPTGLKLRDIELTVGNNIRVSASFGSA